MTLMNIQLYYHQTGCMSKDYTVQEMRETLNNMLVCLDDLEKWSYEKYYCALI